MRVRLSWVLLLACSPSLMSSQALANANTGPPAPCGQGGIIWERGHPNLLQSWRIFITDRFGQDIHSFVATGMTNAGGWAAFRAQGQYNGIEACDARNEALGVAVPQPGGGPGGGRHPPRFPDRFKNAPNGNPFPVPNPNPALPVTFGVGAMSVLSIATFWHEASGDWLHEGYLGRLLIEFPTRPYIHIPDLFADTNGDGVVGNGDILYSLVDLFTYLSAPPTFVIGDQFYIENGRVAGLPGMYFSATPIIVDPVLGPIPSGGEWFNPLTTPFSGLTSPPPNSVALSAHTIDAPSPASLALFGLGLGMALMVRGGSAIGKLRQDADRPSP